MSRRVELLWFSDCPNHAVVRQMLAAAIERLAPGTWIEEVDASDPEVAAARRFPGSPTIRVLERDRGGRRHRCGPRGRVGGAHERERSLPYGPATSAAELIAVA